MVTDQQRVGRLRQVLGDIVAGHLAALQPSIDAALSDVPTIRRLLDSPAAYPIIRRRLLVQVQQKRKHYALDDEVLAFTLTVGKETPAGLDLAELEALNRWLDGVIDRLDHACDSPDAPPAR
jgi:hypothetical protein